MTLVTSIGYSPKVADYLLDKYPETCDISKDYCIPLHIAIQYDRTDLALRLIDMGVDINATDNSGRTILQYAFQQNNPRVIRKLEDIRIRMYLQNGLKAGFTARE